MSKRPSVILLTPSHFKVYQFCKRYPATALLYLLLTTFKVQFIVAFFSLMLLFAGAVL